MNTKHNPRLTHISQKLRKEMTREERHLWYDFLKNLPVTIHRQKVIGEHIVYFYCASANLVIEIDGSQHYHQAGLENDAKRDKYLAGLGLTVKHFSNDEIHGDFSAVCTDIYHHIFPDEM